MSNFIQKVLSCSNNKFKITRTYVNDCSHDILTIFSGEFFRKWSKLLTTSTIYNVLSRSPWLVFRNYDSRLNDASSRFSGRFLNFIYMKGVKDSEWNVRWYFITIFKHVKEVYLIWIMCFVLMSSNIFSGNILVKITQETLSFITCFLLIVEERLLSPRW